MIRTFAARVDVLRNGAKLTELAFADAPTIYADNSAKIKTSIKGEFQFNPLVDYFKDELIPIIILDGVENKYGVYRVGTVSTRYTASGAAYNSVEAYDRGFLLTQSKTETILHISAGTNYVAAIEQLLTAVGITQKMSTPTTATLVTDREDWAVGTEYLDIINQLLGEINYSDIWFNSEGYAIIEPYTAPNAENIDHTYDGNTPLSVIQSECSSETDIFNKPNVFIAVVSNVDLAAPMTATSENDNPLSRISITKRGMRIPQVYKVDNIASQNELQNYINNIRNQSMYSTETVTVKTAVMPGHGMGDVIALTHPSIQGLFEESAWYITMAAGQTMTHKMKRVIV